MKIFDASHTGSDTALDVELLLSTPLSIVVRARLEFADGGPPQEAGLVVARHHCQGDCPSAAALRDAAAACLGRWNARRSQGAARQPRRLEAAIDGVWQTVWAPDAAVPQAA
ncbi:MAG: hypothetical protein ABW005_04135 [Burkholderiaceae bacterium]